MKFLAVLNLLVLFAAQPSMALFEARAGYGVLSSKPSVGSFYTSGTSSDVPSATPNAGYTLDAIVTIPILNLGGGLRTEKMKIAYDSNVLGIENQLTRNSLIINYRLINTLIYLGPIFTYGLSHTNSIKLTSAAGELSNISSNKVNSYSLGLEAGVSLLGFMAGAEIGTMAMKYQNATDSHNTSQVHDLDMSGPYAKIFVGIGI